MIVLATPVPAERAALLSLFESRGWATIDCDSLRTSIRSLRRHLPRVVVTRHRLGDGFSDDILVALSAKDAASSTRSIVLLDADASTALEVRQLALGADCVLRFPIRSEVLAAYVTKFYGAKVGRLISQKPEVDNHVTFCGAVFLPLERTLQVSDARTLLTPREVALIEILIESPGALVTYERLYSEVLGRKFCGDTSNMRVLLGKLGNSCGVLGIQLRHYVRVFPKAGYQYDGFPG